MAYSSAKTESVKVKDSSDTIQVRSGHLRITMLDIKFQETDITAKEMQKRIDGTISPLKLLLPITDLMAIDTVKHIPPSAYYATSALKTITPETLIREDFMKQRLEILECLSELRNTYEDFQSRQILYYRLKSLLTDLRKKATLDKKNFFRVIAGCVDALNNIKSEYLTTNQIDSLEFVLREIREDMDEAQTMHYLDSLIKAGLKPIPKLEGIGKLYLK